MAIIISIISIYTNAAVIMAMTIVVILKIMHYMSIATKAITKFLKKFKKDNFCCFFKMIKEHKSLIFAFPLKIEALSLFCLLNLLV